MQTVRLALSVAFARAYACPLAVGGAALMFVLLVWSGELLKHYPYGWEFHGSPGQLLTISLLSTLFGLLLPLEAAALAKARGAVGAAGGSAGAVLAVLCVSCCAPTLIPALLSFVGFSGTALLSFNGTVRQFSTPLTLASLVLTAAAVGFVSRAMAAACRVNRPSPSPR
jgi:hypothetical protein